VCITANQPDTKSTNANPYPKTKHPTIVMSYVGPSGEIHTRQCRCAVFFYKFQMPLYLGPPLQKRKSREKQGDRKTHVRTRIQLPPPQIML